MIRAILLTIIVLVLFSMLASTLLPALTGTGLEGGGVLIAIVVGIVLLYALFRVIAKPRGPGKTASDLSSASRYSSPAPQTRGAATSSRHNPNVQHVYVTNKNDIKASPVYAVSNGDPERHMAIPVWVVKTANSHRQDVVRVYMARHKYEPGVKLVYIVGKD
jgi:hypothetical protein